MQSSSQEWRQAFRPLCASLTCQILLAAACASIIPLYRYRTFKKSPTQERADRIEALAEQLALPRAALECNPRAALLVRNTEVPVTMFTDPDPFQEFAYPNVLAAKRAIADYPAIPLAKLPPEQLEWINTLVDTTLNKKELMDQVREYFSRPTERESPC